MLAERSAGENRDMRIDAEPTWTRNLAFLTLQVRSDSKSRNPARELELERKTLAAEIAMLRKSMEVQQHIIYSQDVIIKKLLAQLTAKGGKNESSNGGSVG